jgi:cytochrome P450
MRSMLTLDRPDVVQSYVELWRTYGDVARIRVGPMVIHQFVRPEHIRHIMVTNVANYPKGTSHDKLRIALSNGLLTSDGPFWQRQRRLMQPTYTPRGVTRFADVMTDSSQEMMQRWCQPAQTGQMVAINQEMMRLTMSVISRSMFNVDISQDFRQAGDALVSILSLGNG